jgi:Na+/H+ antiporter NhaD/arsenite permease-like protein
VPLLPIDVTAIGIMITIMILGPRTGVSPREGVSGFSDPATITILARMILSEGVRRTGAIQRLKKTVAAYTGESEHRQLGATVGLGGPLSGIINNTAAVAVLLPMVSDLAHENGTSPSKLLLPSSYASMAGGMLTLIESLSVGGKQRLSITRCWEVLGPRSRLDFRLGPVFRSHQPVHPSDDQVR